MVDQKWIRQDTNELYQDWLLFLSPGARLAWVYLKTYVKEAAYSQKRSNVAVMLSHRAAAHRWNVSVAEVDELLAAAVEAKALIVRDGEWTVTDARGFVSERTLDRRSPKESDSSPNDGVCPTNDDEGGHTPPDEDEPRQTGTNADNRVRATETVTGTETGDSETTLRSVSGGEPPVPADEFEGVPENQRPQWARAQPNHAWLMAERVLWQVHDELRGDGIEWDPPSDDDIRRAMKGDGALWRLVEDYGEDEAVAMFCWAAREWSSLPSGWDQIRAQRRQIRDGLAKAAQRAAGGVVVAAPKPESVADQRRRVLDKVRQHREAQHAA
jgi:hypothetical protein